MPSVLESTKKLLHLVGLQSTSLIIIGKKSIANIYIIVFVIVSQIYLTFPFVLFALDDMQLLTRVNNPVYIVISIISMTLIYIDLVLHKALINETIDFLTKIVIKSGYELNSRKKIQLF